MFGYVIGKQVGSVSLSQSYSEEVILCSKPFPETQGVREFLNLPCSPEAPGSGKIHHC